MVVKVWVFCYTFATWENIIFSQMIDVRIAAKYLIHRYEEASGRTMDEMKLHKLLYFTQRESFILLGKPMFPERVTRLKEDSYSHLPRSSVLNWNAFGIISNRDCDLFLRLHILCLSSKDYFNNPSMIIPPDGRKSGYIY